MDKLLQTKDYLFSEGGQSLNAFQERGPGMEKALSVKWSRVGEMTKLPRTLDQSRHSTGRVLSDIMEQVWAEFSL